MNVIRILMLVAALALGTFRSVADIGGTIQVERYTIIDGTTFRAEQGFLRSNGSFWSVTSSIELYSMYGFSPASMAPYSGKTIVMEMTYEAYHSMGFLRNWVRSRATFPIGFADYVIVAVRGHGDPNPSVTITAQPESDRVLVGDSAFFSVDAEPAAFLTYQWYFKGRPIPGETYPWLSIASVAAKDAGIYRVAISSGGRAVMSKNALLQVVKPVAIKIQPKSQSVRAGKNATFRVAVTGTGPFTYQWYFNGNIITNATKSFYIVKKAQTSDAGAYAVFVSNGLSWAASEQAQLTVVP